MAFSRKEKQGRTVMQPQLILELLDILEEQGHDRAQAITILRTITGYLGGRQIYWPRSFDNKELDDRNRQIANDKEAGMTVANLSRKYNMSEMAIYDVLRKS